MKIALLCTGLGNIYRGHEIFARDLFDLLGDSVDITLFKGGGEPRPREIVIANIPRNSGLLQYIQLPVSPKWHATAVGQEQLRIETETFAYSALQTLLEGNYDIIHCLEREVCEILYGLRHLFPVTPKIVFSNGGAIPAPDLPSCDFVQEHTPLNLQRSARRKAFMIPHGVDMNLFRPGMKSSFRAEHGIPEDAFVVISVGTVCYWHKRMDYVIREVAQHPNAHLVIVGQESADTPAIEALGHQLLPNRITFTKLPHERLPEAYAAADVFVLGSLFETFGIVYIEAMAMGVPVIATEHPNQRSIIQQGIFVDMRKSGAVAAVLNSTSAQQLREIGMRGREVVEREYNLEHLKNRYLEQYHAIAATQSSLPRYHFGKWISSNVRNALSRTSSRLRSLPSSLSSRLQNRA
ncbi:MAG: glycosyltransferase family 4 protein [Telluria sp.]